MNGTYSELPPPLLLELLRERYPGGVSLWSFGAETKTEIAFCGEYKAVGFVAEDSFFICSWSLVLPLSEEKARLNDALSLLRSLSNLGVLPKAVVSYKGNTVPFNEAVRALLKDPA